MSPARRALLRVLSFVPAVGVVAVALAQMGVAFAFMLHTRSSEHLTEGQGILESMLVLFAGSICAPIYQHGYIRSRGNAAPASTSASPTSANTRRS